MAVKSKNKVGNPIIYLIFKIYILSDKDLNLQIHNRTKKKLINEKIKYLATPSNNIYIYIY